MGHRIMIKKISYPLPITYDPFPIFYFLFSISCFLSYLIQRENLCKDLIIIKAFEMDGTGSAGCHAQTAALAKHRIDLGLSGKRAPLDEIGC